MKLAVSDHLSLPLDAVTQTFAVLGMRGSGKSNAAVVMAEEMFRAKLHWVAIDPKGDWWGMRSSADGKATGGLPIVVFGGRHGDVPLEPASGPLVADLIIDQTMTCVIDLSEFTEGEKIRFLAGAGSTEGFAARLYRRKSEDQPPTHLFLEEADDYLPQKAMRDKAKLLHDCSRLFLWGRARGVGGTIISQRSARIHKDALTQAGTMIVFRTTAPQDQKAILEWVKYHGQSQELIESLSGLADGEGWVWSPEWLKAMKRVQFRLRSTYDSGRTPKIGQKARTPATLADVDLASVREKMAATIEKVKAEDPKELRKQVAELKKQLAAKQPPAAKSVEKVVKVPVLKDSQLKRTEALAERMETQGQKLMAEAAELRRIITPVASCGPNRHVPLKSRPAPQPAKQAPPRPSGPGHEAKPENGPAEGLTGPEQRLLDELAELQALGIEQPDKTQLALMCGYTNARSGGFSEPLGRLRAVGLLTYPGQGNVQLTDEGRAHARLSGRPATTDELQSRILAKLDGPRARILGELIAAWPNAIDKVELASRLGYANVRSGGFSEPLGSLRTLGLIDYPSSGQARALPVLFLE